MPTPEELARVNIDKQLEAAGWIVQDCATMDLYVGRSVAVREFPLERGGRLFVVHGSEDCGGSRGKA